jgi:hypothetical protein
MGFFGPAADLPAALGSHGLNDKGLQVSWLAPTPFFLMAGAEVFQGENENSFAYHGEGELPETTARAWASAG